jgi:hypothetical protein
VSLGELATSSAAFLPDAQITFGQEGGREDSGNYLRGLEPPEQGVRDRVSRPAHAGSGSHSTTCGVTKAFRWSADGRAGRKGGDIEDLQPDLCGLSPRPDLASARLCSRRKRRATEGPHAVRGRRPRRPAVGREERRTFGLGGGVGASGTKYVPGKQLRVDVMASTGSTTTARRASAGRAIRTCASRRWIATASMPRSSTASWRRPRS